MFPDFISNNVVFYISVLSGKINYEGEEELSSFKKYTVQTVEQLDAVLESIEAPNGYYLSDSELDVTTYDELVEALEMLEEEKE